MALSMDEQRILDEMERNLAAADPRLAARLGSFGQQRPASVRSQHARTIGGVLTLVLIATVTVMMFVVSPFANHAYNPGKPSTHHPASSTQGSGKPGTSTASASGS